MKFTKYPDLACGCCAFSYQGHNKLLPGFVNYGCTLNFKAPWEERLGFEYDEVRTSEGTFYMEFGTGPGTKKSNPGKLTDALIEEEPNPRYSPAWLAWKNDPTREKNQTVKIEHYRCNEVILQTPKTVGVCILCLNKSDASVEFQKAYKPLMEKTNKEIRDALGNRLIYERDFWNSAHPCRPTKSLRMFIFEKETV